ncbi:hypothetical protein bmyco0003_43010 [Bacillus pseudomycoides]|nr:MULTISPECIES: hypothetical protein [Bacillus]EEM03400.1 hypothetical protein bmyco0002_41850 [Bacillus pseudomycoides]EEM08981.1 hypothetical protein bmyco0003_43010 [Bacillus pseudomycoides]
MGITGGGTYEAICERSMEKKVWGIVKESIYIAATFITTYLFFIF